MSELVTRRKPKQGNLVINAGAAIYCDTTDPWYKKKTYRRLLPPWARLRMGWGWIKDNHPDTMYKATLAFKKVAEATRGWERWARRQTIADALKGKDYGGRKRVPGKVPTRAEIDAVLRMV